MATELSHHELRAIQTHISNENDLQKFLAKGMESEGWSVEREAKPVSGQVRADIVGKHLMGPRLGIECKYMSGGASCIGKAIRQIEEKYAGRQFDEFGEVDYWAVAIYGSELEAGELDYDEWDYDEHFYHRECGRRQATAKVAKRLVNGLGVGWTTVYEDRIRAEFAPSPTGVKLPLFSTAGEDMHKFWSEVDYDALDRLVYFK